MRRRTTLSTTKKKIFPLILALSIYTLFLGEINLIGTMRSGMRQILAIEELEVEEMTDEEKNATSLISSCTASQFEGEKVISYATFRQEQCKPDIFFMYTNFNQKLSSMYCCSITSAARNNPNSTIIVYLQDVESSWPNRTKCFGTLNNVFVVQSKLDEVYEGTALQDWYHNVEEWKYFNKQCKDGDNERVRPYTEQNFGNAARLALLYKHGGLYLDLDVITINNIDIVGERAVGMQPGKLVNNAALNFPPHDPFVKLFIDQFLSHFNNCVWGNNGPSRLTQVLKSLGCISSSASLLHDNGPSKTCDTIHIHEQKMFYDFNWASKFLSTNYTDDQWVNIMEEYKDKSNPAFGIHLWNKVQKSKIENIESGEPYGYERLMSQECGVYWRTK